MYKEIESHYHNRIRENQDQLSSVKKKIYSIGTVRLIYFLALIVITYYLRNIHWAALVSFIIAGLAFFLYLVWVYNKFQKQKAYLEIELDCDDAELKALNYDLSAFDGASEKIDASHSYSLDLDVFGKGSLFQSINRTTTPYGKKILCRWFEKGLTDSEKIIRRQEAISELGKKPDFIHHFRVRGLLKTGKPTDYKEIKEFAASKRIIDNLLFWKIAGIVVPVLWISIIALAAMGTLSFGYLVLFYILTFAFSESQAKKVNILQQYIGKKTNILKTYSGLIRTIENESFSSPKAKELQTSFGLEKKASKQINKLANMANELEQRGNMLIHMILNPIWLWDIRKSIQVENWKEENGKYLIGWIKSLGKFDAYISLGTFAFNHPDYIYPTFTDQYFLMEGKALGHPLMNRDTCIRNDIHIQKAPYFLIITGANMAGKSTYLRTIGVNFLLAGIGAPVCAESLTLYPGTLVTSLRTSDSLNDNESYFFAELKRLKMIIDRLENGEKLFIILDEILKGTNSVDKQKGSLALVQQFNRLQSCGIIATHDLLLGSLEKEFPEDIKNYRFEADIQNDELYFSYQLRPGIAQNMNATFLMKKMGITI